MLLAKRGTRGSIPGTYIFQTPTNLGHRVRTPIQSNDIHFDSGQSLRDSMGAASIIVSFEVPMALVIPQLSQTANLA